MKSSDPHSGLLFRTAPASMICSFETIWDKLAEFSPKVPTGIEFNMTWSRDLAQQDVFRNVVRTTQGLRAEQLNVTGSVDSAKTPGSQPAALYVPG